MNPRLVKAILLAILVTGGVLYYQSALRPDPHRLEDFAEDALKDIFGPNVTHGSVEMDLLDGVRIRHLKVQAPGARELALWADAVEIQHDVLSMSAGVLRLRSVVIRGAVLSMHETDAGDFDFDFPFHAPSGTSGRGSPPDLRIERSEVRLRASRTSERFRAGYMLVLGNVHLVARPEPDGTLVLGGGFVPKNLGIDAKDWEISIHGTAQPSFGKLDLHLRWDPLTITPEIRAALSPQLLATLDAKHLVTGALHKLDLALVRDPKVDEGRMRPVATFQVTVKADVADIPGFEQVDVTTREQLNALFGKIQLNVELSGDRVDIQGLTASLGGGSISAKGYTEADGAIVRLVLKAKGVRVDDPALRKALGKTGEQVFQEFDLRGAVDAEIHIDKDRSGPMRWEADVALQDVTVAYRGPPDALRKKPDGSPVYDGFAYAMEHAYGQISVRPGEVVFGSVEGRHGTATVRIRGENERSAAGGETGRVRWSEAGTDVRVTIEARNVPIDADFLAAVDQSEIYDMIPKFRFGGVLESIVVDLFQDPARDKAALVEVSVGLKHDTFTYSEFPLPVTEVAGSIRVLRPPRGPKGRSREFHIDARGRAADGDVTIRADLFETDRRGRWHVTATNVRIEGEVAKIASKATTPACSIGSATDFLAPTGRADAVADFGEFDDPGVATYRVDVRTAEMRLGEYGATPGPMLSEVSGTVISSGSRVELKDVVAKLEGSPVRVSGSMDGGLCGAWDVHVAGEGVRVTEGLLAAVDSISGGKGLLPSGVALHPGGRVDLDLRLDRKAGDEHIRAKVDAKNADLTVKVGMLPVRVRGGFHLDGDDVRLEGLTAEGSGLEIRVPSARLTQKGLEGTATARLTDVSASSEVLGLLPESIRAKFADFTHDRLLEAVDLSVTVAKSGETTIEGRLGLKAKPDAPSGGAPRGDVEFAPIVISAPDARGDRTLRGALRFLGLALDLGPGIEDARGDVEVREVRLSADPSGDAVVRNLSARVAGLSVERLSSTLSWHDGILRIGAVAGAFYGGNLSGEVKVHTRAPAAYEGQITIDGLSLEALHNDLGPGGPDFKGVASLDATFQSRSGSARDLTAGGCLRVRNGDLGELPAFANIPALIASVLQFKSKPKFEKVDMSFWIERETVHADPIVIQGPLFKMKGHGTLDFSGWLDLDLSPEFLKNLALPGVMQIPVLGDVVGFLSESVLYVIRIRGELKNPKTTLVPFPFLSPSRGTPPFQGTDFLGKPTRKIPTWFR